MNFKFLYAFAGVMFFTTAVQAGDTLNIERELGRPGVKLLAVDVYATWCKPCMEAMPKWRALRDKYRDQGLRVIMVHTQDPSSPCGEGVKDFADDVICDEKGYMAKWLRVRDELPSAFLWSWQGNMLVKTGHYDKVESEVKRYLDSVPRVVVEAKSAKSLILDSNLRDLVRAELKRASKFTLVATDEERALAAKIRKESFKGNYRKSKRCKLGQELSANASLQVSIRGKKRRRNLNLNLFSAESGCSLGMVSVPYNPMSEIASVQEGVDKLMSQLRASAIEMPSAVGKERNLKQAGFGVDLSAISIANVEELELGEVSFDVGGANIEFLEAWVKFEETIKSAASMDKQRGLSFNAKFSAWAKVIAFMLPKVPDSFRDAYASRLSQARVRKKAWGEADEAKRKADVTLAQATAKYEADRSKLNRLMKLPDSLVTPAQKEAYQDEFDAAYALYLAEKERRANTPVEGMVIIPGGKFWMGCHPKTDNACRRDEKPGHTVYLDAYKIDTTEVTAGDYRACVDAGACRYNGGTRSYHTYNNNLDDHPINYVNHADAKTYCKWLGKRLPTEAEWEKAARGTDGRKYPWGNEAPTCEMAVMDGCPGDTQPVGSLNAGASPYGAMDMAGNLWEWTADWYGSRYYDQTPAGGWVNPEGPDSASYRVLRGGSFRFPNTDALRASNRYSRYPGARLNDYGFRCAQ